MIHYIKASSEQHMYDALVQAGVAARVYDPIDPANQPPTDHDPESQDVWVPSGEFEYSLKPGVELDVVGIIHTQKRDITVDENGDVQFDFFTVEDPETKQQVPEMVPVRMIMPGDVDQPAVEAVFETQPATYYTEDDLPDMPPESEPGDIKTPETQVEIEPAVPATYHDLTASLNSPVAFHANIRGITGAQAAQLPIISTPSKPKRVWWS